MNSIKRRFEVIKNETDSSVTDMYMYGRIGDPINEDDQCINLKEVRVELQKITTDKIIVHLNSGGGCLFSSIAIHNLLKAHKANIEVVIDSLAGSGGSIIAMAGDKIKMYTNSMLFIHSAHTMTYSNAKGHRKVADDLDEMDKSLKENYVGRFNGTDKELDDLIQKETFLTAEESKELGFCDEIISEVKRIDNVTRLPKAPERSKEASKTIETLMKRYANVTNTKPTHSKGILGNFNNKKDNSNLLNKFKGGRK